MADSAMTKEVLSARWPDQVAIAAGGICAGLGLVVLIGWHIHNATLIQVVPGFAPLRYNTALCFLLCGIGLVAAVLRRPFLVVAGGGIAAGLGLSTLIEYVAGVDLGIDRLLMQPYIERMSLS